MRGTYNEPNDPSDVCAIPNFAASGIQGPFNPESCANLLGVSVSVECNVITAPSYLVERNADNEQSQNRVEIVLDGSPFHGQPCTARLEEMNDRAQEYLHPVKNE